MEKPRFTLRSKLSVALVSLAVVPLVVTAAVLAGLNIFVVSAQALEFRLAVADSAADRVDSLLEEVQSELVGMGQLLLRRDLTPEQIEKLVTAALSGSRRLHHLAVYTPSGKRLVHYHGRNVVAPVSPADELQDDLRYTARQQPFIPLRLEWRDGRPYLPLLLAVFDRSKGKRSLFAYLWASVSLRSLSSSLADLSARRFSRRRNRIYLIDHRFRVLAHGDPSQIGRDAPEAVKRSGLSLQRDTGVTLPLMFRGVKQLAALQSIPTVHWAVVVLQPEGEVFRTIRNTWWTAIAVGFGAGAVALLLGLLMGRRLAKPVVQLA
ncbi:MAG: hypothetical protein KC609_07730, partial [Myxococcales bacterium]|nr:hypothetical protein [Myxococcales bacterium]